MKAQASLLVAIVILLAAAGIYGYFFYYQPSISLNITKNTSTTTVPSFSAGNQTISSNVVTLNAPAVDNQGNGVITLLRIEARPGSGRTLVDINNILFFVDTQNSIQTAREVAANYTHANLSNIDLIYSVETNASVIEGPSAGAALTISTIAALEGKQLPHNVMITGTINPDGTIGPVGGITAKASAAKDIGATIFLVPQGQGSQTTYSPVQQCQQMGLITYCTTEYRASSVDVSKDLGITVKEVTSIQDSLPYFGLS
jgi:uncharacterized protein